MNLGIEKEKRKQEYGQQEEKEQDKRGTRQRSNGTETWGKERKERRVCHLKEADCGTAYNRKCSHLIRLIVT